jgi:hypothetical protein
MLKLSVGIATIALAFMAGGQAMAASSDDIDDFRSTGRSANEWRLIRNDRIHAIKSYDKLDEGKSLRNFRVESDVDADLNTISKVYFDFATIQNGFTNAKRPSFCAKCPPLSFIITLSMMHRLAYPTVTPSCMEKSNATRRSAATPN